jgi:OOP family OmpA-OmpF porin
MSEYSPPDESTNRNQQISITADASLEELRDLLLRPYRKQLQKLQDRLDKRELHARDVGRVLPEAIARRSAQDRKIEIALEPITTKAIRSSIKRDRQVLVDALFPVMGPAIRKAIAAAIQGMIQNFNQALEHSFSIRGFKWRLEAFRTRKPFAEIVLLHTLVYQVKQVFLIHRESGLVLQHVGAASDEAQDPDLVSGMLTAIRDFVQDSFGAEKGDTLDTMRVGERNVWIEHGEHAFLAAVIRGNPPLDFGQQLRDAIDEIHFNESPLLASFDGDAAPFESVKHILDGCLQAQFKKVKRKTSYLLPVLIGVVVLALWFGMFTLYREHHRWSAFIDVLRDTPGILVSGVVKQSGQKHVFGLRDPLAPDPQMQLSQAGLDPTDVVFHWEIYHSQHPAYAWQRIQSIFKPPPTVKLEFGDGILRASGTAERHWLETVSRLAAVVPWIETFRADNVIDVHDSLKPPDGVTLVLEKRTLHARGSASHQWIAATRKTALTLPGIDVYNDQDLVDRDYLEFERISARLQKKVFLFRPGLNKLRAGQQDAIAAHVEDIRNFFAYAEALGLRYVMTIVGHADTSGSEAQNLQISRERGEAFRDLLVERNLPKEYFQVIGVGSSEPVREEITESDRIFNRSVTFRPFEKND